MHGKTILGLKDIQKVYISIASLLLCGSMLMAQSPANRTSKTIVADAVSYTHLDVYKRQHIASVQTGLVH